MLVTGLSLDDFRAITDHVSRTDYGSNLEVHPDSQAITGNRFRARIHGRETDGPGTRRSWSGRRGRSACWHAYRDVMLGVFTVAPQARAQTSLDGFLEDYPATGDKNIGSQMQPAYMPDLCDCADPWEPYEDPAARLVFLTVAGRAVPASAMTRTLLTAPARARTTPSWSALEDFSTDPDTRPTSNATVPAVAYIDDVLNAWKNSLHP